MSFLEEKLFSMASNWPCDVTLSIFGNYDTCLYLCLHTTGQIASQECREHIYVMCIAWN